MKENDIDGVFLQRFTVNTGFGKPDWVLAGVRAAANCHGRIWAIEYDASGDKHETVLERIKNDWIYLTDIVGIRKDPNYAHENGKLVIFVWGLAVRDRGYTPTVADAVINFLKNDPKYGGNRCDRWNSFKLA